MYIIAGLGNPGRDYEHTRHNVGFRVIDHMASKLNINVNKIKFKGLFGEGYIGSEKVILLKPQTYMNLSGESILDAVQFFKINVENVIVVYDDMNIPLGRMRIRPSGSDGGHNGMKSIIYLLESNNFPRLRVGIGAHRGNMVGHVIGRFSEDERKIVEDVIDTACDALEEMVKKDVQGAMNQYNSYRHASLNVEDNQI
jgi:PTH1 family peptidyl-tRNA hydrolase